MARRSTRTTQGSNPGGRVVPGTSLSHMDAPGLEGAVAAPMAALTGRVGQMEEQQVEMLNLLRMLGAAQAPPAPPAPPVPACHVPQNQVPENAPGGGLDFTDEVSSAHPAANTGGAQGLPVREDVEPAAPAARLTREEIREVLFEEYGRVGRLPPHLNRPALNGSPLAPEILTRPPPGGFKLPHLEFYDGTEDPWEHINHFVTILRLHNASDTTLCHVFPATLKGQARTWFHSLREGIIGSFAELTRQFLDQFIANRRVAKDPSHLSGIRQSEGETLKEFFQRFTAEARQIPGVDPELLRGVFLGGLRPSGFYSALMRDTVPSYPDLVHRIEAQIAADEAIEAHRKQFEGAPRKRKEEAEQGGREGHGGQSRRDERRGKDRREDRRSRDRRDDRSADQGGQAFMGYAPLNTTRANVLYAIRDDPALRRPNRPLDVRGDPSRYCEFHRGPGHTTEECQRLKDEIERLIRQGALGRFLQNRPHDQQARPRQNQHQAEQGAQGDRQVVGIIETISGSPFPSVNTIAQCREPLSEKKTSATISFGDEDLKGLIIPHQDPLVICAEIGDPGFRVKRILVDNGSSVNVMFLSTLKGMQISEERLQPAAGPVYGFDGAPVPVKGLITLPVTMGDFPRQATQEVQFVAVDSPTPYNAIFGRPLQTAFGAIASIPHLSMKFSTPAGVGVVRGNQGAARACYLQQIAPQQALAWVARK